MMFRVRALAFAALSLFTADRGNTQGIPVIDASSLAQAILMVKSQADQLAQLTQQLMTAKSQLSAMTGTRGMAALADTTTVRQTLPLGFMSATESVRRLGAAAASKDAQSIYAAVKVFGCEEQFPERVELRKSCEATAYMAPTTISLIQDSVKRAQDRAEKLASLVNAVDTSDAKAALDLQNRISIESAMLSNEKVLLNMALQSQKTGNDLLILQRQEDGRKKLTTRSNPARFFH